MLPVVRTSIPSGWVKTCCSICGHNQCGLMVRVKDGVVEEIVADKSDPVSEGAVCPKGLASIQLLQHPARLKSPLIRAGERGQGKWREASWDEALNGYRTSWMARGSIFSIGLVGASVLLMVALVRGEAALVPVTAASSLVLSGLVASYPGFLMFSILDIKLWRSPLLPILMFSYSVMSGLSLLQLEDLILGVKAGLALSYALLVGTVVLVILSLVFWGNSMHWSQGSREGYVLLTRGRLRVPFVVGVVAVGLASPFLCYACLILSGSSGTLFALAGTSSFQVGAFFFRYSVVKAAFHEPLSFFSSESMEGLNDAG